MKFTEPEIEDSPAKCKEKIKKSADDPLCDNLIDKGG